jgi:hypothetical protein
MTCRPKTSAPTSTNLSAERHPSLAAQRGLDQARAFLCGQPSNPDVAAETRPPITSCRSFLTARALTPQVCWRPCPVNQKRPVTKMPGALGTLIPRRMPPALPSLGTRCRDQRGLLNGKPCAGIAERSSPVSPTRKDARRCTLLPSRTTTPEHQAATRFDPSQLSASASAECVVPSTHTRREVVPA